MMKYPSRYRSFAFPLLSRKSWVLILLLFHAPLVMAERKTVAWGLLGGVTGAGFWGKDVKDFDMNIWPTVGMTLAVHLPVFLGLETDILYVSKNGAIKTEASSPIGLGEGQRTKVNSFKLQALEIPLMLKVTAPTGTEVMPIFFGGPSFAYFFGKKINAEYIDIGSGGLVEAEASQPMISNANLAQYEWSLCLGGGVEWGLGSFQLRFNFGQDSLDKSKQKEVKTMVIALMAGFIF